MMGMIIASLVSFILSVVSVAIVLRLSHIKSWYDKTDERKIHTGDVPRLGGLGFASAFILVSLIVNIMASEHYFGYRFLPVIFAMLLILVFGIIDDFHSLSPRVKLSIQIAAALLVVIPDYTFHRLFFFDIGLLGTLNWVRYPLSALWIIGLTNAVNLIDGVDGLAGGISTLAALIYAIIFVSFANTGSVTLLCFCLGGVTLGFLVFNAPIPRAKIFMGDGGSQFLGFILAVLPLLDKGNPRAELPLPYAAAILLIPIFDTIAAIWRRIRDGRRIDSPDRAHIHHKLINLGLNAWSLDGVLYGLQILVGFLVFISIKYQGFISPIMLSCAYLIGIAFFTVIHYMNKAALKRQEAAASSNP